MSALQSILNEFKGKPYSEKKSLLNYLLQMVKQAKGRLDKADRVALTDYAFQEVEDLILAIPATESYRDKDLLFACEDTLIGLIMELFPNADKMGDEKRDRVTFLVHLVQKEQYIESAVNELFNQETIEDSYVDRLLSLVNNASDEYQKGRLYVGLLHYQDQLKKLSEHARAVVTIHLETEILRYCRGNLANADYTDNLEIMADLCQHFPSDGILSALYEVLTLNRSHISFYAVSSLLALGRDIPEETIEDLAKDLVYADMTHSLLARHGKANRFPEVFSDPVYLAKSDLVHWLTYPTELGKAPDEIEYVGLVKYFFNKEKYYVFKFRSDSDNLGNDRKNKWLIGWSGSEDGTFSNFDEYTAFEKDTVTKTLKHIKKTLLG